ncbi:MAG: LexA repressor [Candidatus Anoxychlamydiales bacterium]|nr:LexA repressor [Candidatus Anoxychlamydiales bacterium]NGX40764.1 LexA repressor [Candidatus Anoxychlamydiales bacterium]HEU64445.1 translesion error-prone DNA polymerase V autoproteolytic subunit [Chlamydiota bacterium]
MNDKQYKQRKQNSLKIPLFLTPIQAGFPSPADDYLENRLDLNNFLIKNPPATFFVKVRGDSMIGAQISDGDILVVDKSLEPKDKKIIIASFLGEFNVKRLRIINKEIYLYSENPKYSPIKITDEMDFEIFGIVTYVIHKTV